MSGLPRHPFVLAVKPVVEALGATLVPADEREPGDLPLRWEGSIIAGGAHGAAARRTRPADRRRRARVRCPLPSLAREDKQRAIRLLDERGAFTLRRAVEDVADAMGVSRITVYNYLNALHRDVTP